MKRFIAGNWKMNKNELDSLDYIKKFKTKVKSVSDVDIVLAVPFTLLPVLKKSIPKNIKLCAQNINSNESGAYTGEISVSMVKDYAEYVIVGHSERRKYFNEDNELLNKKVKLALKHGLKVIYCIGETKEERDNNKTKIVVKKQLNQGLLGVLAKDMKNIIIAYEPVWAIGTGNTATPKQAEDIHLYLRNQINKLYGEKISKNTRIIYGGSVNPNNAKEILSMPNINGALPGGASLDVEKFYGIICS
jgi:triosephosphate isomerase (TIM)